MNEIFKNTWTLCSESSPPDLVPVYITWENPVIDDVFSDVAYYYNGNWYWYSRSTILNLECDPNDEISAGIKVVAWMFWPEPYLGG